MLAPQRRSVPAAGERAPAQPRALAAILVLAVVAATTVGVQVQRHQHVSAYLHGAGVAIGPDGAVELLPVGTPASALLPGSRVLAKQGAEMLAFATAQRAWVAAGTVPGEGTRWESMARDALLDLHTLTLPSGATPAGWARKWRYVWPRDAAFVAAAYAATGHLGDARAELAYLQRVQGPSGVFEARYVLDGSGPPDGRWAQSDSTGWVLWATGRLARAVPALPERVAVVGGLRSLVERSTATLLELTDAGRALPPPSPDYRELPEDATTLGISGPFLAGLQAAPGLLRLLGDTAEARAAARAAARFTARVTSTYGPTYPRIAGTHVGDVSVTFVLPPFTGEALPGAALAATQTAGRLVRPAGGLGPGTDWRDHTISWTAETALFALADATNGDPQQAAHWMDWLDTHRTAVGSLPEKVDGSGRPAGSAPLAWTDALVLLTLARLTRTPGAGQPLAAHH
ncbi:MAG TPA: glycoside hydrolase family 15 [Actinomycetes bacterium]|nr:glycoside hydrolase family 15 [Actinomycetes bacterium]